MSQEKIIEAIHKRRIIKFEYEGKMREGEPHKLGHQDDRLILELYQIDGESRSDPSKLGWRRYGVDKIQSLCIKVETFTPRKEFNPDLERWESSLAEV